MMHDPSLRYRKARRAGRQDYRATRTGYPGATRWGLIQALWIASRPRAIRALALGPRFLTLATTGLGHASVQFRQR
jgi:hypothetical protein